MDKNMLLVQTVEKFPCLYNYNLPEFHKKDVTDKAWNDVAREMNVDAATCREKWRNLRYGLSRSLKPNTAGERKKYYLHNLMEFVVPYMKNSNQADSSSTNIVIEPDAQNGLPEYDCDNNDDSYLEPPEKKQRVECPEVRSTEVQIQSAEIDDSRKIFLLSLVPELNEFTEKQMRAFRRKVLTLIDEIAVYTDSRNTRRMTDF